MRLNQLSTYLDDLAILGAVAHRTDNDSSSKQSAALTAPDPATLRLGDNTSLPASPLGPQPSSPKRVRRSAALGPRKPSDKLDVMVLPSTLEALATSSSDTQSSHPSSTVNSLLDHADSLLDHVDSLLDQVDELKP